MLIDTSTLRRTLQPAHPQRETARSAIKALAARGLTFDKTGFSRYTGIEVVHPNDVVS